MTLEDDNREWQSCLIDPDKNGYYEMRPTPHGVYPAEPATPAIFEEGMWFDQDSDAIQFYPLDPSQWQWAQLSSANSHLAATYKDHYATT